jgi:hypothetical protein
MATKLLIPFPATGYALYGIIWDGSGNVWNGSAFVPYVTANRATYAIMAVEQGTASKVYELTIPAIAAEGAYTASISIRAGAPGVYAESDSGPIWQESFYWSGTAIVPGPITLPADPAQCTGYLVCYDAEGNAESGVRIRARQMAAPASAGTAYAFDGKERVEVSDANGYVEFLGLWRGGTYRFRRGNGEWREVVIPNAETYAIAALLGQA